MPVTIRRHPQAAQTAEILLELFDGFIPRIRRAMVDMLKLRPFDDPETDQSEPSALVEAIASRDSAAAAQASRTHLSSLKAALS